MPKILLGIKILKKSLSCIKMCLTHRMVCKSGYLLQLTPWALGLMTGKKKQLFGAECFFENEKDRTVKRQLSFWRMDYLCSYSCQQQKRIYEKKEKWMIFEDSDRPLRIILETQHLCVHWEFNTVIFTRNTPNLLFLI